MTYGYLGGFTVVVDVNGNKSPNKICKDVFKLSFTGSTIKDSEIIDGVETSLCEDLDNGIEKASGDNPLSWISNSCGEERKKCAERDPVDYYSYSIYDENGTASSVYGGYWLCPDGFPPNCIAYDATTEAQCRKIGYTGDCDLDFAEICVRPGCSD